MKSSDSRKFELRKKRALRVRRRIRGTAECPRLCVVKSNKHLQVQLIDDEAGCTLYGLSTVSKQLRDGEGSRIGKSAARKLGQLVGEWASQNNITVAVFDRGWAKYHGVVAELADAAREQGLQF